MLVQGHEKWQVSASWRNVHGAEDRRGKGKDCRDDPAKADMPPVARR
jgi:hypothetical protein